MLIEFILIIGLYWDYKHLLDLYFMELYICGLVFYRTVTDIDNIWNNYVLSLVFLQ